MPSSPQPRDLSALLQEARNFIDTHRLAPSSERVYSDAWRQFERWLTQNGHPCALPIPPKTVAAYLAHRGAAGKAASTMTKEAAAISDVHRRSGHAGLLDDPLVSAVLAGARRTPRKPARTAATPLRPADIEAINRARPCPALQALRNRGVLLLSAHGKLPLRQVVLITRGDIAFGPASVTVRVPDYAPRRHNSHRRTIAGTISLAASDDPLLCPVRALQALLAALPTDTEYIWSILPLTRCGNASILNTPADEAVGSSITNSILKVARGRAAVPEYGTGPYCGAGLWEGELRRISACLDMKYIQQVRDRAMVFMGYAVGLRAAEIVALRQEDLDCDGEDFVITVRRSKTDQAGRGATLRLSPSPVGCPCPVRALTEWLTFVRPEVDYLFQDTNAARPANVPLCMRTVDDAVKRLTRAAGLQGEWSTRSMRAGYITSCAEAGRTIIQIAKGARHTEARTTMRYIRQPDASRQAVRRLGL